MKTMLKMNKYTELKLPQKYQDDIDFQITSPPYMSKNNHPQYPFAGYKIKGNNC